jgi:hypothetical protein
MPDRRIHKNFHSASVLHRPISDIYQDMVYWSLRVFSLTGVRPPWRDNVSPVRLLHDRSPAGSLEGSKGEGNLRFSSRRTAPAA